MPPKTPLSLLRQFHVRSVLLPTVFAMAMAVAMIPAVHIGIHRASDVAIAQVGTTYSMDWANFLGRELEDVATLARTGRPTEADQRVLDAALSFPEVYRFKLFDDTGRVVLIGDSGGAYPEVSGVSNETAAQILLTEEPVTFIMTAVEGSDQPAFYGESYVPLYDDAGALVGVVEVYVDATAMMNLIQHTFDWLATLIPILCFILFAVPTLLAIALRHRSAAVERHNHRLSMYDPLTGAMNRGAFNVQAAELFDVTDGRRMPAGVIFIDVDRFKFINDEHGHAFGDRYLQYVAALIAARLDEDDIFARMGGDEFVILLPDASPKRLSEIANKILVAGREPFEDEDLTVSAHLSIGTHHSLAPETEQQALHAADLALYHSKVSGRDRITAYYAELDVERANRRRIETALRHAWAKCGFELHFQPLIKVSDKSIIGFEALLRLTDPEGQPISPSDFIPVAEQIGLIHDLGIRTIVQAIEAAKTWPEGMFVSVNLSAEQFRRPDLVSRISDVIAASGFPAHRLELEVTESVLMHDEEVVADILVDLKGLGVSIAMDDFGTGYSSLGYLWKYRFDKLKVDRIFLEGFEFDPDRNRDMIETIVLLGRKLGMAVTVEGVETEEQSAVLADLGCDQMQGYFFGRPSSAVGTDALLKACPETRPGAQTRDSTAA